MKRERFPLSSEQMELLLAFESTGNLEKLADHLAKDASVVSRNLQKLAAQQAVIVKVSGRWRITPLGRQINSLAREYLQRISDVSQAPLKSRKPIDLPENSLLIAINTQKALHAPALGRRSNTLAETNIRQILALWRQHKRPRIHVQHISQNPASPFFARAESSEFILGLGPTGKEPILQKSKASAFYGTRLEKHIRRIKPDALVLVGFTAGECIDATARQASDLGFRTFVVADATATFEAVGPKGKLLRAEKLHQATMTTLHALFAQVIETDDLVNPLA